MIPPAFNSRGHPRRSSWWQSFLLVAIVALVAGFATRVQAQGQTRKAAAYGQLPLAFEINEGQTDPAVKFLCRGTGYGLYLSGSDAVLALTRLEPAEKGRLPVVKGFRARNPKVAASDLLRLTLLGANPHPVVTGTDILPGKSNYFIGNDPTRWHTDIPLYAQVKTGNIYPGIDLVYYGRQRQLEYDYRVAPGADPGAIRYSVKGAQKISLDARGNLVLHTTGGDVVQRTPVIYQEVDGKRETVAGGYEILPASEGAGNSETNPTVGFRVAAYDQSRELVIDPVLTYSTYLGTYGVSPSNNDYYAGNGIAVDSAGNTYITGQAAIPTSGGGLGGSQYTFLGAFVSKLNSNGTNLVYNTYIGANANNATVGFAIAVDGTGSAYITGQVCGADLPIISGAFQNRYGGGNSSTTSNAFVTKLSRNGNSLIYSSYLGGSGANNPIYYGLNPVFGAAGVNYNGGDIGYGIALDGSGNAYVAGVTISDNFPTTAGAFQGPPTGNYSSAFVAKVNAAGTKLVYSTCLSGTYGGFNGTYGGDMGSAIAVDGSGNAYVTGFAGSTNFPVTSNAFQTSGGGNAFVAKMNATGTALVYSSYLGGSIADQGNAIAVDGSGNAYVAGLTSSIDFPVTGGAYQTNYVGTSINSGFEYSPGYSGFVTKVNPAGTALVYSTFLGGTNSDYCSGIAVDGSGNAYVAGQTSSQDFPVTYDAIQYQKNGLYSLNAFVTELSADGSALVYSTYLGGSYSDYASAIALDGSANAYITGLTTSTDFPTTPEAYDTEFPNGGYPYGNAFVAELTEQLATITPIAGPNGSISPNTVQTAAMNGAYGVPPNPLPFSYPNFDFTATPESGYVVNQWLVNGHSQQSGGNDFDFTYYGGSNTTVEVTFSLQTFLITPSAGSNGGISPSTPQSVASGSNITLNATPSPGYAVSQWTVNGAVAQTGGTSYTLADVTGTAAVNVSFETLPPQTITFAPIPTHSVGDAPFPLNATSSAGLPVSLSVVSGPAQLDVSGTMLTVTGAGPVEIEAYQGGNSAYLPAAPVFQYFTVIGSTALFEGLPDVPVITGTATRSNAVADGGLYSAGDGQSNFDVTALRWDALLGITNLNPTGPPGFDSAFAISANGTMMAGRKLVSGTNSAFVYSDSAGVNLLAPPSGDDSGEAHGISGDESTVVGYTYAAAQGSAASHAVEWINGSPSELSSLAGSQAYGVSSDGAVVVGAKPSQVNLNTSVTAAVVFVNGVPTPLKLPSNNVAAISGTAFAVAGTADNYTVVGGSTYTDSNGNFHLSPFYSVNGGQPVSLGQIDPTDNAGEALSVCADGTYIVGYGTSSGQQMATIWDQAHGLRALAQALTDDYGAGAQLAGWQLLSANGISPDGFAITGNGINPQGALQAWRVTVPRPATVGIVSPAPVGEGARSVAVTVNKSIGVGTTVTYQVSPGTAIQAVDGVGDYDASQLTGQLRLNTVDTSGTIPIPLNLDLAPAVGGSRSFTVVLTAATNGAIISSGTATVTIEASQTPDPNAPPLPQAAPLASSSTGALQIYLAEPGGSGNYPTRVPGQVPGWKFAGESTWHGSGEVVQGLTVPGQQGASFLIDFESVVNFGSNPQVLIPAPAPAVATVLAGGTTSLTIQYPQASSAQTGTLEVDISPNSVADDPFAGQRGQWNFLGETVWNDSGSVFSLPAGSYLLGFSSVPDYAPIPTYNVEVTAGSPTVVQALYQDEELVNGSSILPQSLNYPAVTGSAPYEYVGQVSTDVGTGSGVAVADRVVLTAAHVIFDDATQTYSTGVQWRFELYSGNLEPQPLTPAGGYILSGYAAARVGAPSDVGTPASQQQDAAVLFFNQSAGNGGSSGYLVSGTSNQWLLRARQKTLIGYPMDTKQQGDTVTPGVMQATAPQPVAFSESGTTSVFSTTRIAGLSGMSGGPLCVQYDDGLFYPAGIYLGGNQECVVRSIDADVQTLIETGTASGGDGQNHLNGSGVGSYIPPPGSNGNQIASVRVIFSPATPGASWRFTSDPAKMMRTGTSAVGVQTDTYYTVFFNPVPTYKSPANFGPFELLPGETQTITVGYSKIKAPVITTSALPYAGVKLPYSAQIQASNGATSYEVVGITDPLGATLSGGLGYNLGLTLANNGKLTGTLSLASGEPPGTYLLSVTASNGGGTSGVRQLALTVAQTGSVSVAFNSGLGSISMGSTKLTPGQTLILPQGEVVTLAALPSSKNYVFGGWWDNSSATPSELSPDRTLQFTVPSSASLTGSFISSPFLTAAGSYNGLLSGDVNTANYRGYFTATLTSARNVTMAFNVGTARYSIKDTFADDGSLLHLISGPHGSTVATLNLQLGFGSGNSLAGTVTLGGTSFALAGYQTGFSTGSRSTTRYSVILPYVTGPGLPEGDGYGTVTVTPSGGAHFAGTLGDGTPVSESTTLDANGDWPFYAPLYQNAGVITGWLNLRPAAAPAITGTLEWLKPSLPAAAYYPNGFTLSISGTDALTAEGSPLPAKPLGSLSAASFQISGGGLSTAPAPFSVYINNAGNGSASANGFTLKINTGTGTFTGQFLDQEFQVHKFNGILLEPASPSDPPSGFGLFNGDAQQTGSVQF